MNAVTKAEESRRRDLSIIHLAKKDLQLTDDEYRDLMLGVTGKTSSAQLDWQGRHKLIEHFKKLGFKVKGTQADRPAPNVGGHRQAQIGKIEALLADAGRPWAYADGLVKKLFASTSKVERIEFCDSKHLGKVIAALAIDATRRSERAAAAPTTAEADHAT
jgi:phage gp16-like protein